MAHSLDFKTKKSLGQNFLNDANTIEEIANVSGATKDDVVVEIGPGLGALTEELSKRAGKVIAVELDDRLIPILRAKFLTLGNVEIVHEDILKYDWSTVYTGSCQQGNHPSLRASHSSLAREDSSMTDTLPARHNSTSSDGFPLLPPLGASESIHPSLRIVGNLPYYITTPILLGILEKKVPAKNITVMVQKEVADRIVAKPGGKDYGVLSISLQYYCECRKAIDVPREYFSPAPNVDSAVVVMELKTGRSLDEKEEEIFFALVKKAFSQRRKTLLNSLDGFRGLNKTDINNLLNKYEISAQQRAETLSVEQYIALSKEIKNA